MAKAISYKRVSLGRQVTGDGLRRQDDAARAYCDRTGDELDEEFVDAGVSAFRGRNAAVGRLGRLMELAEEGTWEPGTKLLVEHFDRLSRDKITEARQRAERILKVGITIVTLADGQEYTWERINNDLGAIIVMTVMMFKSHEDSDLKGARVAAGKAERRAGARRGNVKMTRQCPFWIRPVGEGRNFDFELIVEKPEGVLAAPLAIVHRICQEAEEGMGKRLITSRLNRDRLPAPKGKNGWHHSTVGALLHDRRLIGEWQPTRVVDGKRVPDGDPVPDYFPAAIDIAAFHRLQAAVRGRRQEDDGKWHSGRKGYGYPNLFSGLAKCICGAPLVYDSIGHRQRGLFCRDNARGHGACHNRGKFHYPVLEAEMIRALSLLDFRRLLATPRPNYDRGEELSAQITDRIETQRRLLEAFTAGTPAVVLEKITTMENEIATLRAELAEHNEQAGIADAMRDRDAHTEFLAMIARMNDADMSDDERFTLRAKLAQEFGRVIDEMVADPEGITVRLKPSLHHRVEFRLCGPMIESLRLWSRDANHPDYPNNPLRPLIAFPRPMLLDPEFVPNGLFAGYMASGA